MENNNDQKWKLADVLANFTKSQLQKQQEIAIREEMKQRMMDAQAQNLAQFVPGAQPAPQEEGFPQDFAMAKEGGIHIDPSKRGTFKAQATRMGMSVQEAARHILANKDKYSSKMVKKANFARNFAKEEGGEMLGMDSMGGDDDDRRWWQFWKKDKPITYEDKIKAEIANIDKYIAKEKETLDAYYRFAKDQLYNPYTKAIDVTKSNLANLEKMKADAEIKIKDATAEQKANFDKQRDEFEKQANQKAYGGQMNNAPQNSGFQALPDYVQKKILENMEYGGSYDLDEYGDDGPKKKEPPVKEQRVVKYTDKGLYDKAAKAERDSFIAYNLVKTGPGSDLINAYYNESGKLYDKDSYKLNIAEEDFETPHHRGPILKDNGVTLIYDQDFVKIGPEKGDDWYNEVNELRKIAHDKLMSKTKLKPYWKTSPATDLTTNETYLGHAIPYWKKPVIHNVYEEPFITQKPKYAKREWVADGTGDTYIYKDNTGKELGRETYQKGKLVTPAWDENNVMDSKDNVIQKKQYGGELDEYKSGGYTVRRSTERKGKTHVVIGPDGTKKYFGDPGMGERGKSKYGKEAFYKRHAQNLKDNPYFRAYARATWEEGGEIENEDYENEENENEDYEMVSGIADILQQVRDKENRRQIAENMIEDFEEEDVDYNLQKFMDMAKLKRGGEMIRRADGSYSQRGFWDNIRANKGSGKAPTKEMLAQERKIKRKKSKDGGEFNPFL